LTNLKISGTIQKVEENMYRIFTERKNVKGIKKILSELVEGYTMYKATGAWKGVEEGSLVIELEGISHPTALLVASSIKAHNRQESVLLQNILTVTEFV
jgi:hypothetical protein